MGDIHQIHLQFIVRSRIVLAVHLRVTGQASLGLQPQSKLRHFLTILGSDLRAFRAWAYNGQVSLQDIEKLGQLVQTAGADDMTNLRNTVVFVTSRKTRHTVFFGIHTHGAELQNLERFAVFGKANLPVKSRTTIGFDCNSRNQKQRTQDNQCYQ